MKGDNKGYESGGKWTSMGKAPLASVPQADGVATAEDDADGVSTAYVEFSKSSSVRFRRLSGESSASDVAESLMRSELWTASLRSTSKRVAISAEQLDPSSLVWQRPVHEKGKEEREQLLQVLKTSHHSNLHMMICNLDGGELDSLIGAMCSRDVATGECLIEEGAEGDYVYVVRAGSFDILQRQPIREEDGDDDDTPPKKVFEAGVGSMFGEEALLYNCQRSASVVAREASAVWALDRTSFRVLVVGAVERRFKRTVEFLRGCSVFGGFSEELFANLAESVLEERFQDHEVIVADGEEDDKLFILRSGAAVACVDKDGKQVEVMKYSEGDSFSDIAPPQSGLAKAVVYASGDATCLYITRAAFQRVVGSLESIMGRTVELHKKYEDLLNEAPSDSLQEHEGDADKVKRPVMCRLPTRGFNILSGLEDDEAGNNVPDAARPPKKVPESLAEKVAMDFTNEELVKPVERFVVPNANIHAFGGLRLGEKHKDEKVKLARASVESAREEGEQDESYVWSAPSKLKGATHVAVLCQKGLKKSFDPTPNQDNFFVLSIGSTSIYGVCDGHGPNGHLVSFRLVQSLPSLLSKRVGSSTDWEGSLKRCFKEASDDLLGFVTAHDINVEASGTTACVLVYEDQSVHIATVGDSRVVLASYNRHDSRLIHETTDHLPQLPAERARLEAAGAEVREVSEGSFRIFRPSTNFPGLTMSRAFGDTACGGVLQEPDYCKFAMQPTDEWYAVLASDGVWEFMGGETVVNYTAKKLRLKGIREMTKILVDASRKLWGQCETDYVDDITALVVQWNASFVGSHNNRVTLARDASPLA